MDISVYSFIDMAKKAAPLMADGGSLITLTYQGSRRATPWYNVMGVAKAALESAVVYLANDLGPQKIRVNAVSPGPMKTLSGAAIGGARKNSSAGPRPTPPCVPTPPKPPSAARRRSWRLITGPAQRVRS